MTHLHLTTIGLQYQTQPCFRRLPRSAMKSVPRGTPRGTTHIAHANGANRTLSTHPTNLSRRTSPQLIQVARTSRCHKDGRGS